MAVCDLGCLGIDQLQSLGLSLPVTGGHMAGVTGSLSGPEDVSDWQVMWLDGAQD